MLKHYIKECISLRSRYPVAKVNGVPRMILILERYFTADKMPPSSTVRYVLLNVPTVCTAGLRRRDDRLPRARKLLSVNILGSTIDPAGEHVVALMLFL